MKLIDIKDPKLVRRIQQALGKADDLKKDIAQVIPRKRIRQRSKGPNNLELEALGYLVAQDRKAKTGFKFRFHALTLLLANGCKYTVDIVGFSDGGKIHAWEIKGKHSWDDAIVKLKVAANQWPSIQFYLMWKEGGVWQTQFVFP